MIRSIFGRAAEGGGDDALERQLQKLEEQAKKADLGFDAAFLNRAGDLCIEAGDRRRALRYYGRAVDAYLRADRFDAAGAVCRKIVRLSPKVVRARCTLAWLSIGKGLLSDAEREIQEYVKAAVGAGQQARAAKHLRMMADASSSPELRRVLADLLLELDDVVGAAELMSAPEAADSEAADAEARWAAVLRAALMGPEDLDK